MLAVLRYIAMLQKLPTEPKKIGTRDLCDYLNNQGFDVSMRTVQRDLNNAKDLMKFEITCDENRSMQGWCWSKDAKEHNLKKMNANVAITLKLFDMFIEKTLPPAIRKDMAGFFKEANSVLSSEPHAQHDNWTNRIAVISKSLPLLAPKINKEFLETIYEAVRLNKQVKLSYRGRQATDHDSVTLDTPIEKTLNPHAIVLVDENIYLLANSDDDKTIKNYALPRVEKVDILKDNPSKLIPNFNLQTYIDDGHFGYFVDKKNKSITVRISMTPETAAHFKETPLSEDQKFEFDDKNNREILEATVTNTKKLRWWIRSFSHEMIVLFPKDLREELLEETKKTLENYEKLTQNL